METLKRVTRIDHDKYGNRQKRMRFVFRLTPMEQGLYLQNKRGTLREMQAEGYIAPYGCDCGICRADGDCCGRYILSGMKSVLAGDRLVILQRFERNI